MSKPLRNWFTRARLLGLALDWAISLTFWAFAAGLH